MSISQELIQSFFTGTCTESEADAVAEYLKKNPDVQEKYLNSAEWNMADKSVADLPENVTLEMWSEIRKKTQTSLIITFKRLAIAASFLGFLCLVYFIANYNGNSKNGNKNTLNGKENIAVIPKSKTINNRSEKPMLMLLPDSSIVTLEAKSQMSYEIDPSLNRRTIILKGSALFKVAKDKTRPFSVVSGDISTTALGTQFFVACDKVIEDITVTLYEGKVAIKTSLSAATNSKIYYLLPGKKFIYNKHSLLARIVDSKTETNNVKAPAKSSTSSTVFNNEDLSTTLDRLATIYNVHIDYQNEDLNGLSFIGGIRKSDSIQNILRDICLLNNLSLHKKGNAYIINKKKNKVK